MRNILRNEILQKSNTMPTTLGRLVSGAVLVVCIPACWVIPPPFSIQISIRPIYSPRMPRHTVAHHSTERQIRNKTKQNKKYCVEKFDR